MTASVDLPENEALIAWRHDFHQHPETAFEEHRTSARIAALLSEWGFEVTTGIAGTGVVAALDGRLGKVKPSACGPISTPWIFAKRRRLPTPPRRLARCTPAAMMVTPPCYWAPPGR